jgi:hypothetical protein
MGSMVGPLLEWTPAATKDTNRDETVPQSGQGTDDPSAMERILSNWALHVGQAYS